MKAYETKHCIKDRPLRIPAKQKPCYCRVYDVSEIVGKKYGNQEPFLWEENIISGASLSWGIGVVDRYKVNYEGL